MAAMKSKTIDVVLFDLGNTLLFFEGNWPQVLDEANRTLTRSLQQAGVAVDTQEFTFQVQQRMEQYYTQRQSEFIELTTAGIIHTLLNDSGFSGVPDDVLRQALRDMYSVSQAHWLPEEDSLPMLEKLCGLGYRLGLISNAGDDADVQLLIDKGRFRGYFDVILTSAAEGIRKPNPDIFYTALATWGARPDQAVMVGDTLEADIQGARNAGITGIWITRRVVSSANREQLDAIIPDASIAALSELPGLLAEWVGRKQSG
jgi:FMN phosphatase YigB (HAD superfamily)